MFEYEKFFNYLYRKNIIKKIINHINLLIVLMFVLCLNLILFLYFYIRSISVYIFNTPNNSSSKEIITCLFIVGLSGCLCWINNFTNPTKKFSLNKKIFCYFNALIYYIKEREDLSTIKEILFQLYTDHLVLNIESYFAELKNNIDNLFIVNPNSDDCKILYRIEKTLFPKLRAFSKIQGQDRKKIIMVIESILNLYCYRVDILEDTHKSNLSTYISSSENDLKQKILLLIDDLENLPEKENSYLVFKFARNKYITSIFLILIFSLIVAFQISKPNLNPIITIIVSYGFGLIGLLNIIFNAKWFNDTNN